MGKAIQKKWFGPATTPGSQIVVSGVRFADGTTATSDYIIKQTGSTAYVVQDSAFAHDPEIVFMVNAASVSALLPGQCFILATPFGGSPLPCEKISQYRVSIYDVANTVARETGNPAESSVSNYSWSTVLANAVGQADLISGTGIGGAVLTLAVNAAGAGYLVAPVVILNGGGTGGAAHTTLTGNGTIGTVVIDSAGTGYSTATLPAPPASVTATCAGGTANGSGGVNTGSIAVTLSGGYYSVAPTVSVGGGNAIATATISAGRVTAINISGAGTGYATTGTFAITIAAPNVAPVQATLTSTFSV